MAATLWQLFVTPVYTSTQILSGGAVEIFYPGTTGVSNRKTVYLDSALSIEAANPYTLDANGTANLYSDSDDKFHITIDDKFGANQYDFDYIKAINSLSSAIVSSTSVETFTLVDGQLTQVFVNEVVGGTFHINGGDADNGRLLVNVDYTVDDNDNSVTLVSSYPGGSLLSLSYAQ